MTHVFLQAPEYQHHRIEDLCRAGNQQKVLSHDDAEVAKEGSCHLRFSGFCLLGGGGTPQFR